jgi:hypothetical protein
MLMVDGKWCNEETTDDVEGYGIEFLMRFFFIRDRFFKAFGFVWNKFFNGILFDLLWESAEELADSAEWTGFLFVKRKLRACLVPNFFWKTL